MGLSFTVDSVSSSNGHHVRNTHALIRKTIAVILSFLMLLLSATPSYAAMYDDGYRFFYHGYSFKTETEWNRAVAEVKTLGSINGRPVNPSYTPPINYRMVKVESAPALQRLTAAEVNSAAFRASVVPEPSKLGAIMRHRMMSPSGIAGAAGGALLGVAAVEQLLKGIGWIMDPKSQSIWMHKPKDVNNPPPDNLDYADNMFNWFPTSEQAANSTGKNSFSSSTKTFNGATNYRLEGAVFLVTIHYTDTEQWCPSGTSCQDLKQDTILHTRPKLLPVNEAKEYLSDADLGNAMLGKKTEGNHLPDDTGTTSVSEAATPIPEDGNNSLADEAIAKAQPETSSDRDTDSSSSTETFTSTSTTTDPSTGNQTKTTTTTTTKTDPSTGTKTSTKTSTSTTTKPDGSQTTSTSGSASPQTAWPKFCDWAKVVCDHIDWTQEKPKLETPEQPDKQDLSSIPEKPTINFNGQCPPPINFNFEFPFKTFSWDFQWTNLCNSLIKMKPYVLGISNLMAVFILLNARKEMT